ncbi:MAG: hypothetical protein WBQ18_17600 [Solirubrobacteraceae bacterium]
MIGQTLARRLAALALITAAPIIAPCISRADEYVVSCGNNQDVVFQAYSSGLYYQAACPNGGLDLYANADGFKQGQNSIYQADAPSGLLITSAWITGLQSGGVNAGSQGDYGGDFYWSGGTSLITPNESPPVFSGLATPDFGFQLVCGKPTCSGPNYSGAINVAGIVLTVHETSPPTLAPSGIWQAAGWIRGTWTLAFSGDSPSGMCTLTASLAGQTLPGTSSGQDATTWHQCAAAAVNDPVYTSAYPQGTDTLQLGGVDAAGLSPTLTKQLEIDNQQPTVSLSGPSQAPSTAGPQYVTATATAGPSGVYGISCNVDGGAAQWYPAATVQVPVGGVGQHQVQCSAQSNAIDQAGVHATSTPQTFTMTIGVPTVAALTFSRLVDALRCHRVTRRVRVPARWLTITRGHKRIRVLWPAHIQRVTITRCHARIARRRITVWVTVHRHGKRVRIRRRETVRVVVLPHVVDRPRRRVGHGGVTSVHGWLGTSAGLALGGQSVEVLAAPDNGSGSFSPVATTTTAADGSWSATIPAGPSRIIQAVYNGGAGSLPSQSSIVHETVPAEVRLISVSPRRVAWGGTVRLVGQLVGGYLPRGGALVRLRIGEASAVTTYGVREHVGGRGRFVASYTFGAGLSAIQRAFWFQVASLPMGDYPFAPADSRRVSVLVGGHPAHARR